MNTYYPLVSARGRHVCEYCRAPEAVFNPLFEVRHIRVRRSVPTGAARPRGYDKTVKLWRLESGPQGTS